MISLKKKVLTALSVSILAISLAGCGLVEETQESIDGTVLAKVGDTEITQKDVDTEAKSYIDTYKVNYGEDYMEGEEGKEVVKDLKVYLLNGLVEMRILDKKIEESGIETDTEEIKKAVEERIAQVKGAYENESAYEAALTEAGFTAETYLTFVTEDIVRSTYYETIFEDVKVTDEDVTAYYEANKASYLLGPGAKIYHIIFGSDDAAKTQAEDVLKQIKDGEIDFAEAAKKYGNDISAEKGGLLGYYEYDTTKLISDFMIHVKDLKNGEMTDVVQTKYGYHIIKVDGIAESYQVPLEDEKVNIEAMLLETKQKEKYASSMEEWKKEYNVKIYEDKIK